MNGARGRYEKWIICGLLGGVVTSGALVPGKGKGGRDEQRGAVESSPAPRTSRRRGFGELPLSFEPNLGQTDQRAQFVSRIPGGALFLAGNRALLRVKDGDNPQAAVVQMQWVGASDRPAMVGVDRLPGHSHYFIGGDPKSWRTKVPQYRRVMYSGVYPGVDLVFYGNHRQLEYDFVVSPGADPNRIRLAFEGVERLTVDPSGDLVLTTAVGEIRQRRPDAYQTDGSTRRAIAANYVLRGREVSLQLGAYDRSQALIIDPVIVYSSYLGGTSDDVGNAIAIDASGNAYVTGETNSLDFPIPGAFQTTMGGLSDAFVTKIDPTGSTVLYSTYLGGDGPDRGNAIAVDGSGNIYVTGRTGLPNMTAFPTTSNGPFRSYRGGEYDAWVAEISADGSQLFYSTYFGGFGNDAAFGIALDGAGSLYVVGGTRSTDDFPVTPGVVQPWNGGDTDAWIAKIDPSQVGFPSILWASFWGGSFTERANGVAVDANGNVYMTGMTRSRESDWAMATGFQTSFQGGISDGFLAVFNDSGTNLIYSTYLGGSGEDFGNGVAVDASGLVYVVGQTASADLPVRGGFQTTFAGGPYNAFLIKIDPAQQGDVSLLYSTFLGPTSQPPDNGPPGNGLALNGSGQVYVVGTTSSPEFPATPDAFQVALAGGSNAFIAKIDPSQVDAASLIYASYLGGSGTDVGLAIAADGAGNAFVTGKTSSTDFPTVGGFQSSSAGRFDAFVAKIAD